MTHQSIITLLSLQNRRRLQIILIKAMHHLFQIRNLLVEARQVHIAALLAVAVRVERVGAAVLVVGEEAEILRPVAEGGRGVDEGVGTADGGRGGEALEEPAVGGVVGVPPHLCKY